MTVRHMRLTLGLFFLCAGTTLLALRVFAPDVMAKAFDLTRMTIGAFLALVFAGLNLAKWYAGRLACEQMTTPVRRPLQPDPTAREESGPNPAFDFNEPTDKPANP